jgi:hypothetical protein
LKNFIIKCGEKKAMNLAFLGKEALQLISETVFLDSQMPIHGQGAHGFQSEVSDLVTFF